MNLKYKKWFSIDLPQTAYPKAMNLQRKLVDAKISKTLNHDIVLFLEHAAVFTLGRRGGLENLHVSKTFLKQLNIPVISVERGGNITYHGPGQLVVYPIIDIDKAGLQVIDYVNRLEEVMVRAASDFGIAAEPNPLNRGIWVGNNKLGSIGISVRRNISFHGLAFNVNLSLEPFGWINPCGLQNIGVTSLSRERSQKICMQQVRSSIKGHMQTVFGISLEPVQLSELKI